MNLTNNKTTNAVIALLASLLTGAILAAVMYFITFYTGFMIGYVSWGIGFAMAYVFLYLNNHETDPLYAALLVIAFIVFFYISNFVAIYDMGIKTVIMEGDSMRFINNKFQLIFSFLRFDFIKIYFSELSSFFDIIFYAIGILPIYRMMVKDKE